MPPRLGIVAGGGELPARLITACKKSGRSFFVLAIEGQAEPPLLAGEPHDWVRVGDLDGALRRLREAQVDQVVMAGKVRRPSAAELAADGRSAHRLAELGRGVGGDNALMRAIVDAYEAAGFRVVAADSILDDAIAQPGALGRLIPGDEDRSDIERGVQVARALGRLDVGHAVVVQAGRVLGVEAAEGTDELIARCARLRIEPQGGVLVKVSKPQQQRCTDPPTIGPDTVRRAAEARLAGIAIEAGETIVLDRAAVADAADEGGLFVVAIVVGG